MIRQAFHTQEKRGIILARPVLCNRDNAWLGTAFYFWLDDQDAFNWGRRSKRGTGQFEVYAAELDCEDVLDTVFNEEHYWFWVKQIEKAAKAIMKKNLLGGKPTIKLVNEYLRERAGWTATGIMFQDIPVNDDYVAVIGFYYKKRIQIGVFDERIILSFRLKGTHECD